MKNSIKKMVLIFLTVVIVASIVSADEIVVFVGEGHNYDKGTKELVETSYKIIFNTESEEYYFYTSNFLTSGWVILDKDDAETFRANLLKYQEWEKIAIKNEVAIQKELPDSQIVGDVRWKKAEEVHSGKNITLKFIFLSQSMDWHQLVITSTTIESTINDYFFTLESLYLASEQVGTMIDSLSPEAIKMKVDEYSDLQEIESLFE